MALGSGSEGSHFGFAPHFLLLIKKGFNLFIFFLRFLHLELISLCRGQELTSWFPGRDEGMNIIQLVNR